ncbi:MAG: lysozyme inhibitor LprI family protein [Steroidobacteraceae bacterium]
MNDAGAPCRDKVVTVEAHNCFQLAATSADKRLNQTYNKILAKLSPDEQTALRNAERLWVQFRDTTCAAERDLYDGGTAAGVAFIACIEEETRLREIDLVTMYQWRLDK